MIAKKAFAIAAALLMMLAVFTVVGTTSVSAQETTVVLKKPVGGEEWSLMGYYKVIWAFTSGDQSQIIWIHITGGSSFMPWWSWEASSNPGAKVPTSCTVLVPAGEFVFPGERRIGVVVQYYSEPGVEATATDYRTVTLVDITPPLISTPSQPQTFVLGADSVTTALLADAPYTGAGLGLDLSSVRVTVDGRSAPAEKVSIVHALSPYQYWMHLKTDWLSLGKHKVTVSVSDKAGNVAKASWVVQVVGA